MQLAPQGRLWAPEQQGSQNRKKMLHAIPLPQVERLGVRGRIPLPANAALPKIVQPIMPFSGAVCLWVFTTSRTPHHSPIMFQPRRDERAFRGGFGRRFLQRYGWLTGMARCFYFVWCHSGAVCMHRVPTLAAFANLTQWGGVTHSTSTAQGTRFLQAKLVDLLFTLNTGACLAFQNTVAAWA